MRLRVRVTPHSSREKIVESGSGAWRIFVRETPEDGKANERLCELIAKRFHVAKSHVRILKGYRHRDKLIEVG